MGEGVKTYSDRLGWHYVCHLFSEWV